MDTNTNFSTIQEENILNTKFAPKKEQSLTLSEVYQLIFEDTKKQKYLKKVFNTFYCGSSLTFAHQITSSGISPEGKLIHANFCRDRFCPMCQWRKSLKLFGQLSLCMSMIKGQYKFVFLTLTVPNVSDDDLQQTITDMLKGFDKLMKRREVKRIVKGFFRTLEITRNNKLNNWHPHIHILLAMPLEYGSKDSAYIPQNIWLKYWRESMQNNDIEIVWIETIKNKKKKNTSEIVEDSSITDAINEVAKYSVKGSDILKPEDLNLSKRLLLVAEKALFHRKLFHLGGVLKEAYLKAKLQSVESENADLTDSDTLDPILAYAIIEYQWKFGVYVLTDANLQSTEYLQKNRKVN